MARRSLIPMVSLCIGLFFAGAALADKTHMPQVFSGTVFRVDPSNRSFAVQNQNGEMVFQWDSGTSVHSALVEKGSGLPENLREGMFVTVIYAGGDRNPLARRIDVTPTKSGWEYPFECGTRLC